MAKQYSDDYSDYSPSEDFESEFSQTVNELNGAAQNVQKGADLLKSFMDRNNGENVDDLANPVSSQNLNNGQNLTNALPSSSGDSLGIETNAGNNPGLNTAKGFNGIEQKNPNGQENPGKNIGEKAGETPANKAGKEAAGEGTKNAVGEASKKAAEESAKNAAADTAKGTAGAAVGASTAGVGTFLMFVADAGKKVKEGIEETASGSASSKKKKSGLDEIIVGVLIAIFVPALFISAMNKTVGGPLQQYLSDQAYNAAQTKQEIDTENNTVYDDYEASQNTPKTKSYYDGVLKEAGGFFKKIAALLGIGTDDGEEEKESPYDVSNAYYEAAQKAVDTIKNSVLTKARTNGARGGQIEKDINAIIKREGYDDELTWTSFDADADIFDGMNYAEFISVLTENESFNAENAKHEEIVEYLGDKKKVRLLYRLYIEPAEMTAEEAGRATPQYDQDGNVTNQAELDEIIKYGKVTLRRYYLRDLYEIFELDAYAKNYEFKDVSEYITESGQQNIDMLDRIEETMRSYCDISENANVEELLGSATRSEYDGEPTDTPIDNEDEQYEYTSDESGENSKDNITYFVNADEIADVHGQIGAEIGDITDISKVVAQQFVNINPDHPYGNGKANNNAWNFTSVTLPWGSFNVTPCCASGTTLVAKYFGLKANVSSATGSVANELYAGTRVSASSISQLRVGDIITYGSSHTEIVTKIDADNVYIAGFGSDNNIKKDAENGYNKIKAKSASVSSLDFNGRTPTVWRPNEFTFDFGN